MKRIVMLLGLILTFTSLFGEICVDHLYYEIIGDDEVRFTKFDDRLIRNRRRVGRLEIPPYIDYNGKRYTVTELGDNCLHKDDVTGIYDLVIPHTIKQAGTKIFDMMGITRLWLCADFPFPANSKQFSLRSSDDLEPDFIPYEIGSIFVPEGTMERYGNATGFRGIYGNVVEYPGLQAKSSPNHFFESDGWIFMALDTTSNAKVKDAKLCYYINQNQQNGRHLDIPSTLTVDGTEYVIREIADEAFFRNNAFISVHVPSTVTKLGFGVFAGSNIEEITGMENVAEIGNACFASKSFKRLQFPKKVDTVPDRCFADGMADDNDPHFELIEFHENVRSFGKDLFYNRNIGTMICRNPEPAPIDVSDDSTPFGQNSTLGTLYVPAQSVELYKNSDGWNRFAEILPITNK